MLIASVEITTPKLVIRRVVDVQVVNNWRNLTQTASITLPRKSFLGGQEVKVKDYIKPGDSVTIKAGYNGNLETWFTGYVARLNPNRPVVIECEDEMYKLKRKTINRTFAAGTTLKAFVSAMYSGPVVYIDPTIQLGEIQMVNATAAQGLQELQSTYSLYSFFRGNTLVVGYPYNPNTQRSHIFNPDFNIVDKSNLIYRTKEETQTLIHGISVLPDGSSIKYDIGESGGSTQTRHFYNISLAELKRNLQREYDLSVFNGWNGNFTAWGKPYVNVGDVVDFQNNYYPEYNGKYLVDAVTRRLSVNGGIRQIINPGPAAGSVVNQ